MPKVSIVKGPTSPDSKTIQWMTKKAVDLVGGMKSLVSRGDIVALKPNVVTGKLSGKGVTTDPRVIEALIKLSFEEGAKEVLVIEGAGYGSLTSEALRLSGILDIAENNGAKVIDVDKDEVIAVEVENHLILDEIPISKRFYDAEVKINVPVMKTHDQMLMTLGMKNLKGVIQKPTKRLFHRVGLAKTIVDLNKAVPIDLTVVDAIYAMEGLGPSFGEIVELDIVMASKHVYSLDFVGSQIMGIKPNELEYLKLAEEQGLIDLKGSDIEVVGEPLNKVTRKFKRPPMDLSPQEGIEIIEKGACSACRGSIRSVFYDLERTDKMNKIRNLVMLVGPEAELPEDIDKAPLIMGICLQHLKDEGRYVVGCPPNNDQMIEAIRELTKI